MKATRLGAWMCLGCMLPAGCRRKPDVVALPPVPPPLMMSVPPPTHRTEALARIPLEIVPPPEPQLSKRPLPRFRPQRATRGQLAALNPLQAPVELGRLTAGGKAGNDTVRQETEELLRGQQRRLAALPQESIRLHGQQVQQATLFLRQAEEAWKKLDIEGTRTLATKARVLLDELQA